MRSISPTLLWGQDPPSQILTNGLERTTLYIMKTLLKILTGIVLSATMAHGEEPPAQERSMIWVAEVRGMSCPLCANNIEKQLKRDKAVESVEIDLGSGVVKIFYSRPMSGVGAAIKKSIEDAGFSTGEIQPAKTSGE
jgi:copper chaperone CopZ